MQAVLSGRFTADGNAIERIDIHRLKLGDSDLSGTVVRRDRRRLARRHPCRGARCAGAAEKRQGRLRPGEIRRRRRCLRQPPPLAVNARIGRLLLGPKRELRQVAANLLREGGEWRSAQIDAQYQDGGALWLRLGEAGDGGRLMFQSDDLGAALKLLDVTDTVIGGRIRIDGKLSREAGKQVLRAHLEGEDYKVKNSSTALRVLSLPSLTGIASAISGSGLPFSTLRGDIVYRDGVLSIEKALGYGESIGVTASGWIDTGRDRVRLNGTVAPAYAVNSLPGKVPVIGAAFGGSQGLFAADFRLGGAISAPEVAVSPLSALAPGGLRELFSPIIGFPKPQPEGGAGTQISQSGVSHSGALAAFRLRSSYSVRAISSISKHSMTSPTWMFS